MQGIAVRATTYREYSTPARVCELARVDAETGDPSLERELEDALWELIERWQAWDVPVGGLPADLRIFGPRRAIVSYLGAPATAWRCAELSARHELGSTVETLALSARFCRLLPEPTQGEARRRLRA